MQSNKRSDLLRVAAETVLKAQEHNLAALPSTEGLSGQRADLVRGARVSWQMAYHEEMDVDAYLREKLGDMTVDDFLWKSFMDLVGPAAQGVRDGDGRISLVVGPANTDRLPQSTAGHAQWLVLLGNFNLWDRVELHSLELDVPAMSCLACANVTVLRLRDCAFPLSTIEYLACMEGLEEIELDLSRCPDYRRNDAEKIVIALCKGSPTLRRVLCSGGGASSIPPRVQVIRGRLEQAGKTEVQVDVQAM